LTSSSSWNSTTFRRLQRPQYATMHGDISAVAHGFHLLRDGDAWAAVGPQFVDLQQAPAGLGATPEEAVGALRVALRKAGYRTTPSRRSASSRCTANDAPQATRTTIVKGSLTGGPLLQRVRTSTRLRSRPFFAALPSLDCGVLS
jgi:hypothetical protein